jgi:hypothetical protein
LIIIGGVLNFTPLRSRGDKAVFVSLLIFVLYTAIRLGACLAG